jgi:Fe2+ transport protein
MAARRRRRIWGTRAPRFTLVVAALLAVAGALVSGCGTSSRTLSTTAHAAAATNPAAPSAMGQMSGGSGSMSGSGSGSGSSVGAPAKAVDGVTPIPTQTLGSADWQHMKIMAQARTAVPFVVDDGTTEKLVKPSQHTSFHLMVMLSDDRTNYPIPYASVWATIRRSSKIVFDERQWPMISEYMGPHYGNNVTLPGPGTYQLSLLVSPPVSARHIEYAHIWMKPHRVNFTFRWNPSS